MTVELAALMLAALVAGTVDAIAGGGGLISLPALLAVGLPPHVALGTNKAQSMWGTAAALWTYARAGQVALGFSWVAFPLALVGSATGAVAVQWITPAHLRPVVMVMLALASVAIWLRRTTHKTAVVPVISGRTVLIVVGLAAYDGFFGPGTGTFLVVALSVWCALSLPSATAHAKVVNLGSNIAAVSVFVWYGEVRWDLALPMAAAQLIGGRIGAKLAIRRGGKLVRAMVTAVAFALIAKMGWELLH
jgi:uncharacterized protein